MLGAEVDAFLDGQRPGYVQRPVVEVRQKAILVQSDSTVCNDQIGHDQVFTLSKRTQSSTKPG